MKKKPIVTPVISREIMELAKKSVDVERRMPQRQCAVCGGACTAHAVLSHSDDEDLCWVCRRLKISAWRDSDQQISAQE